MEKKIAIAMLTLALAISTTACNSAKEPSNKDSIKSEEDAEPLKEELPEETENETSESNISDDIETEKVPSVEPTYEDGSTEKEIQNYAVNIIIENYEDTDIQQIEINENLGTEEGGDYIILARLTWNMKNSGATSKKMLEMYSSDFAARIGTEQPTVNEVAIFWTVPYLDNANAKWSYERMNEGMYLSDNMMDSVFNQ